MAIKINVYFHDQLAGELSQDKYGTLIFQYHQAYLDQNGDPISYSLPLFPTEYYGNEAHAFFTGLLPEEEMLTTAAQAIGTSNLNYFKLLIELGKEPIGAICIGEILHPESMHYEEIKVEDLDKLIQKSDSLLTTLYSQKELRLSLAGAQSKTALYYSNEQFYIPQKGSPSNIVVKPPNKKFPNLEYNEYACMKMASLMGIVTPDVRLMPTPTQTLYLIDRYDRFFNEHQIERIHQEDFCQALGIQIQNKYELDGGPTFVKCVNLLRKATSFPAIEINKFISMFLFNFIIGNKDAHGKNYSILYQKDKTVLAPAYDILSTTFYPDLSLKMAMSINGTFEIDEINEEDLQQMAKLANVSGKLVLKEYQRIKGLLLPTANQILSENIFPDHFKEDFYRHLNKMHAQLPF
jgi:serine/threonine-protein kinase HipA